jgi:hypothetical protein
MPTNVHFATKGRDGIVRESALVTFIEDGIFTLYERGVITDKRMTSLTKQLMAAKTAAQLHRVGHTVAMLLEPKRNPRRRTARRRNPYTVPYPVVPGNAQKGDRIVWAKPIADGGCTVMFGFADADDSGNFEFRVSRAKPSKFYSTVAGAERAATKWLTTGK